MNDITKQKIMKIKTEEVQEWNSLKDFGDITKISFEYGINRIAITNAFNGEDVSEQVYTAVKSFYKEKKIRLENLTN